MSFKAGDKVAFLHEKCEAVVTKVLSEHRVAVEIEGIEIVVDVRELVHVNKELEAKVRKQSGERKADNALFLRSVSPLSSAPRSRPHSRPVLTVDLHADKIYGHSYSMNNAQKLSMQLDYFMECLERALKGHVSKIVFIHGVGNGILRQSIRDILKRYDGIEFSDGSYREYGAGATEVRIISRNKFKESFI